ncbi:MAG: DUF4922 domain-containing protein [Ignavibacteriales bacterium]|nr:MAG: DUF4922 domain-containing protein [Ignavibacteriales bacterium]
MDNIFFDHPKLIEYISSNDYSEAARLLLREQLKVWKDLDSAYTSLKSVQLKSFQYNGFVIKVQHNPGRVKSSTAKVDEKSIKERKCFLCPENLYNEQQALKYGNDFLILVNPFPILTEHYTIPHVNHIPQRIREWFGSMLLLSKDMQRDVLIYNGPKCGASAPDHLHFQAGSKFFMPLDDEFHSLKNEYGEIIVDDDKITVAGIDDGLRKFISVETNDIAAAEFVFKILFESYLKVSPDEIEPMMNILVLYEPQKEEGEFFGWRIIIFLRNKHRSSHYFRDGEDRILLSPAAVDLGGLCILPFKNDFEKITKNDITEIFKEVSIGKEQFEFIKADIKKSLSGNSFI